jgi:hypothetical protein
MVKEFFIIDTKFSRVYPLDKFIIASLVISFVLSLSFVTNSWTAEALSNAIENPTIIDKQTLNVDKRRS